MINKYKFNRKGVDQFLKSIHPIYKRNKNNIQRAFEAKYAESPPKSSNDSFEMTFTKTNSPISFSRIVTSKELSPIKSTTIASTSAKPNYEYMRLTGSPLCLKKRYLTPLSVRTKPKQVITKIPIVKWNN
jgi:hypothetical protein